MQYFLVQVTEAGSLEILNKNIYQSQGWKNNSRNHDHGKVKKGDILLVYFAGNSIRYTQQLKKVYTVDIVSSDNVTFYIKEIKDLEGIPLNKIKNAIAKGRLSKTFERIGLQGFNIKQITESDYNSLLTLDSETLDNSNIQLKKQSNTWVVRAGEKGDQEDSALAYNIVTIGWNELPDLFYITDKYSLTNLYYSIYTEHRKHGSQAISQIWNFLRGIKKSDIVILPSKKNENLINIGIVEGEYEFKELEKNIKHIRYVKWLKNIPISDFELEIVTQLRLPKTVYKVNANTSEAIINLLKEENLITISSKIDISPKFSMDDLIDIIQEFRIFLNSNAGQEHIKDINKEKQEVQDLLDKLESMDKNSQEFIDWVLYGLLPNSKTKYAKRTSTFPAFMNIKQFFKNYKYNDNDWKMIANMIYNLLQKFQQNPEKLPELIDEFTSDRVHSRSFQSGSISPLLFCINDSFPLINSRVMHTYNDFSSNFDWNDIMSPKLDKYVDNIKKCNKLISFINIAELKDFTVFDLFCYWYNHLYERKRDSIEEEEEEESLYLTEEKVKIPLVDIKELLNQIIVEDLYNLETHSLRNPERVKLNQIIQNCEKGNWVLPNFQRYYTWKKNNVKEFLESIFNDYYVGALLFWESTTQDPQLDIIPIKGVNIKKEDMRPSLIILDGQQRLTSIYYAIKAPGFSLEGSRGPLYFYVNFVNLLLKNDSGEIIEILNRKLDKLESYKRLLFPIFQLEKYSDWVDDMEDYMLSIQSNNSDKIRQIRRIIDKKLRHIIDGYEIPYISLPESIDLSQITDIFEKINTMGKKLDSFDLLIARLSKYDIELKKLWEEAIKRYPNLLRYHKELNKMPIYILQAISLSYNKTSACSREDILNIYQNIFEQSGLSFDEIWYEMIEYINDALLKLENLRDGFGVKDENKLPFSPTIPILAALLKEIDLRENKLSCYKKLNIWYWSSIFSNAYSGAVDSQLTLDYKEMRDWFSNGKIPKTVENARKIIDMLNLKTIHSRGSAIYKGIMSILALKSSKDINTGRVLENVHDNDRDHLFPKSRFASENNINSVLNMTWMSAETNRKIKRFEKPSQYLHNFLSEKYRNDEKELLKVLETHFINKDVYEYMLKDNFELFLSEREKLILVEIKQLLGIIIDDNNNQFYQKDNMISPEKPFSNKRLMWNTIRECQGYLYWIDKYFSIPGLELLSESLDTNKIKNIKILSSIPNTNLKLRDLFIKFKKEINNHGIECELRIITDKEISSKIHDRWILSKYVNFNIPSPDVVLRGQYSEIKRTNSSFPFDNLWNKGLDIITNWNVIEKSIKEYQSKRIF